MKRTIPCGRLFYLAMFAAWLAVTPVSLFAQDVPSKNSAQDRETILFRGLLRSLSIQRRSHSTSAEAQTSAVKKGDDSTAAAGRPEPSIAAANRPNTLPGQTPSQVGGLATGSNLVGKCFDCGSLLKGGICSSTTAGNPCNGGSGNLKGDSNGKGGSSNGGSAPATRSNGLWASSGGGDASSVHGAASGARPAGTSGQSSVAASQSGSATQVSADPFNGAADKYGGDTARSSRMNPPVIKPGQSDGEKISGTQSGSAGQKGSSRLKPSDQASSDIPDFTAQMNAASTIASRAAAGIAAAHIQPGGTIPQDPNGLTGTLPAMIDSIHAAAGAGPGLRWKVVKPAGIDPSATQSAISLETGQTDDSGDQRKSFTLDTGVVRSALVTGPENPLLVPPEVASIVYVIDCSGSMAGSRFTKVARTVSDAIAQMNANQQFAVLLFNNLALQIDDGGLLPATDVNKSLVTSQLSQVMPVGGTDPTDALFIAVQMKPETIVVLSDGEFDEQIVHRVTRLNRTSGVNCQINCVGISTSVSVLRALASLNGPGNYIESP